MLTFLSNIVEAILNVPQYILWAAESFVNLIFAAIEGLVVVTTAILPSLPETVAPPELVTDLNWFFPIGAILAIATPLLAGYVVFLAVRWIFQKVGEL